MLRLWNQFYKGPARMSEIARNAAAPAQCTEIATARKVRKSTINTDNDPGFQGSRHTFISRLSLLGPLNVAPALLAIVASEAEAQSHCVFGVLVLPLQAHHQPPEPVLSSSSYP